jgi:hypothetical protein
MEPGGKAKAAQPGPGPARVPDPQDAEPAPWGGWRRRGAVRAGREAGGRAGGPAGRNAGGRAGGQAGGGGSSDAGRFSSFSGDPKKRLGDARVPFLYLVSESPVPSCRKGAISFPWREMPERSGRKTLLGPPSLPPPGLVADPPDKSTFHDPVHLSPTPDRDHWRAPIRNVFFSFLEATWTFFFLATVSDCLDFENDRSLLNLFFPRMLVSVSTADKSTSCPFTSATPFFIGGTSRRHIMSHNTPTVS